MPNGRANPHAVDTSPPRSPSTPDQSEPHFPLQDAQAAYVCLCPYCRHDLTGFYLALKARTGDVVFVAEPVKCRFCGRYLLYRRTVSPVLVP